MVQGTRSSGVKGISVAHGNFVSAFTLAHKDDVLGLVSNRGGLKRIRVNQISPMNKTTQGKQIYREIKGNPHLTIDVRVVEPSTKVMFTISDIKEIEFKNADITSVDEGFSLIGPTQARSAKIMIYDRVYQGNEKLIKPESLSEEEQFSEAEKAIDALDQISLDDLLKDL